MVGAILLFDRASYESFKVVRAKSWNHDGDMVVYTVLCGNYRQDCLRDWGQAWIDSRNGADCSDVSACESIGPFQ